CAPHLYMSLLVRYAFILNLFFFFVSSRRRHTISKRDWSSDVCSSDLRARHFIDQAIFDSLHAVPRRIGAQQGGIAKRQARIAARSEERRVGIESETRVESKIQEKE